METFELKSVEKTPIVSQDHNGTDQNYNTREKEQTKDDNGKWSWDVYLLQRFFSDFEGTDQLDYRQKNLEERGRW